MARKSKTKSQLLKETTQEKSQSSNSNEVENDDMRKLDDFLKKVGNAISGKENNEEENVVEAAAEEAKEKAAAEAKMKAEAEAKKKAEEEAKMKAEAEAKKKAEAEAKMKAEAEAKKKAE
ncbi:MAG: hypothetical protein PWR12_589, partial [Eubacteriaceae bacterium]|nr:hypothetical protein [Eubacteriaceae bacterium]